MIRITVSRADGAALRREVLEQQLRARGAAPTRRVRCGAVDFREVDYTESHAIVLGAELDGLSDKSVDYASQEVKIPINGMVDSLNVSVANAVILYEMQHQRLKAGLYKSVRLTKKEYHKLLFEFSYPEVALVFRKKSAEYPKLDDYGQIIS